MRGALVLLTVIGCKATQEAPPPKPASVSAVPPVKVVHRTSVRVSYIIVVPKGGNADTIVKLIRERFASAHLDGKVEVLPAQAPDPKRRVAESATNPELQPADLDAIDTGTYVAVTANGDPITTLRVVSTIARAAAIAAHGWVVDVFAGRVFPVAEFEKHIPGDVVDVREQIVIHEITGGGDEPWLDSMGMVKLGFPELAITAAPTADLTQLAKLMDAVAQTMLANPDVHVPGTIDIDLAKLPGHWYTDEIAHGGTGRARFRTSWRKDDEGEDEIELLPADGSGTEGFEALVVGCFGAEPDVPTSEKADDSELMAAAQRARSELSAMRAHFAKGVPVKERLSIKAPFSTDDGQVEWMWVDIVRWTGDTLEGTLDNDPDVVKTLKAGSHVKVPFAKVGDFIHVLPDGTKQGGYSLEVFKKRGLLQ